MDQQGKESGFEHAVSGLLRKRAGLFNEAERLRDRLAEVKNDLGAIDRTLGVLGYQGDLDAAMPRQKRQVLFGQGELARSLIRELRDADGPMTSRELAQSIIALKGDDVRDRRWFPKSRGASRNLCGFTEKQGECDPRSTNSET